MAPRVSSVFRALLSGAIGSGAAYTLGSTVAVRGAAVLKFLLLARLLGPDRFADLALLLLVLALVDAITEFGLVRAYTNDRRALDDGAVRALWSALVLRGAVAGLLLAAGLAIAGLLAGGVPAILYAACAVPPLRALASPGPLRAQRDGDFAGPARLASLGALADVALSVALVLAWPTLAAAIVALLLAEAARLALSWALLPFPLAAHRPDWTMLPGWARYSRWVWGSNILVAAINQLDRVLLVALLPVAVLAQYQAASRIALVAVAELGIAAGTFVFNRVSADHRDRPEQAYRQLDRVLAATVPVMAAVAGWVGGNGGTIVALALGPGWEEAARLLRVFAGVALLAGVSSLLSQALAAVGRPKTANLAMAAQLGALLLGFALLLDRSEPLSYVQIGADALAVAVAVELVALQRARGYRTWPLLRAILLTVLTGALASWFAHLTTDQMAGWPALLVSALVPIGIALVAAMILVRKPGRA